MLCMRCSVAGNTTSSWVKYYTAGVRMIWNVALAFFDKSIMLTGMAAHTDGCWEVVLHCRLVEPLGGPGVQVLID